MSFLRAVSRICGQICDGVRRVWSWHSTQMQHNGRYARAFIQGVVRALWQGTVERFLFALGEALVEVYLIVRQDGFTPDQAFSQT